MSCTNCDKKSQLQKPTFAVKSVEASQVITLFNANDLQVVDHNEVRIFEPEDWPADRHKLIVFIPEAFTPVCTTELGALNRWREHFAELECVLIAACSDQPEAIQEWYQQEPLLKDLECLTFSSYLLPARLGLVEHGRAKRSSVFVMADGSIIKQEHFAKVGRSFEELHRMLYGYQTDSYCSEGWQPPADGVES